MHKLCGQTSLKIFYHHLVVFFRFIIFQLIKLGQTYFKQFRHKENNKNKDRVPIPLIPQSHTPHWEWWWCYQFSCFVLRRFLACWWCWLTRVWPTGEGTTTSGYRMWNWARMMNYSGLSRAARARVIHSEWYLHCLTIDCVSISGAFCAATGNSWNSGNVFTVGWF